MRMPLSYNKAVGKAEPFGLLMVIYEEKEI